MDYKMPVSPPANWDSKNNCSGNVPALAMQASSQALSKKVMATSSLKEKLPQAFMQIGWMEDDFRNLTAKVWANLENPIKRYDFSKVPLILCMSPSQVPLF